MPNRSGSGIPLLREIGNRHTGQSAPHLFREGTVADGVHGGPPTVRADGHACELLPKAALRSPVDQTTQDEDLRNDVVCLLVREGLEDAPAVDGVAQRDVEESPQRERRVDPRSRSRTGRRSSRCVRACVPTSTETPIARGRVAGVPSDALSAGTDRVAERRRAVALARHYREFEGLWIQQIADRLGRSPATIKAYFYDPS